jgi:hypothetical protein
MKSICLLLLALGLNSPAIAQVPNGGPRLFSYQGLAIDQNGSPVPDGQHVVLVTLWNANSGGPNLYQETHSNVNFRYGVFDLVVGSANAGTGILPEILTFDRAYWIEITLDPGSPNQHRFPRQQILSAPYAFNSLRAGGIAVSAAPMAGNIFPLPMQNGKIDPSFLPPTPASIQTINTVGPNGSGGISLLGSAGITVTNDPANNAITIRSYPRDTMVAGTGIDISSFGPTKAMISIAPAGITSNMIGPGEIQYDDIANGAVWGNNIATGGITQDKIAPATDYTMVAVGTTSQRPASPVIGMIRFNTTTSKFEGFDGTNWVDLN